jgi:hypothetical protein
MLELFVGDWSPAIAERIKQAPPVSFRELQQTIAFVAFAARQWVAQRIPRK